MCICFFGTNLRPGLAFLLCFNRDEFISRPTAPMHFWTGHQGHILAGRDLTAGGTWLGLSVTGRVAFLTNLRAAGAIHYRQQVQPSDGQGTALACCCHSRGELTTHFLSSDMSPLAYCQALDLHMYHGFNLVCVDTNTMEAAYTNNAAHAPGVMASASPAVPIEQSAATVPNKQPAAAEPIQQSTATVAAGNGHARDMNAGDAETHVAAVDVGTGSMVATQQVFPGLGAQASDVTRDAAQSLGVGRDAGQASGVRAAGVQAVGVARDAVQAAQGTAEPAGAEQPYATGVTAQPHLQDLSKQQTCAVVAGTQARETAAQHEADEQPAAVIRPGEQSQPGLWEAAGADAASMEPTTGQVSSAQPLEAGKVYGLSNGRLNEWAKVQAGMECFTQLLQRDDAWQGHELAYEDIFEELLGSCSRQEQLHPIDPKTQQPLPYSQLELEQHLDYITSSRFVEAVHSKFGWYGTRSQTVVAVWDDGVVQVREHNLVQEAGHKAEAWSTQTEGHQGPHSAATNGQQGSSSTAMSSQQDFHDAAVISGEQGPPRTATNGHQDVLKRHGVGHEAGPQLSVPATSNSNNRTEEALKARASASRDARENGQDVQLTQQLGAHQQPHALQDTQQAGNMSEGDLGASHGIPQATHVQRGGLFDGTQQESDGKVHEVAFGHCRRVPEPGWAWHDTQHTFSLEQLPTYQAA